MDPAPLEAADAEIRERRPEFHSLLVLRGGVVSWQRHYGGTERDLIWTGCPEGGLAHGEPYPIALDGSSPQNVKSVTKSVLSALVGIALGQGRLDSIDRPIGDWLGGELAAAGARDKAGITLRHLLQMRSGLAWTENGPVTVDWIGSGDLLTFTLTQQPLSAAPGARWEYSTADSHLLAVCLQRAVGEDLLAFALRELFEPIGAEAADWLRDATGHVVGGSELHLRAEDLARFGLLYAQDGRWGDRQVVPERWVAESTAAQPGVGKAWLRERARAKGWPDDAPLYDVGYGMQWWRACVRGQHGYAAKGHGGQTVLVLPGLDLVVIATMSTVYEGLDEHTPLADVVDRVISEQQVIDRYVVPAALGTGTSGS